MTPTPEHIERLALAGLVEIEPIYHGRLQCNTCNRVFAGYPIGEDEPGRESRHVGDSAYLNGWRVINSESTVMCPDCAADATEGESG